MHSHPNIFLLKIAFLSCSHICRKHHMVKWASLMEWCTIWTIQKMAWASKLTRWRSTCRNLIISFKQLGKKSTKHRKTSMTLRLSSCLLPGSKISWNQMKMFAWYHQRLPSCLLSHADSLLPILLIGQPFMHVNSNARLSREVMWQKLSRRMRLSISCSMSFPGRTLILRIWTSRHTRNNWSKMWKGCAASVKQCLRANSLTS